MDIFVIEVVDADNVHIKVDIQDGITSITDFVEAFNNALQANMPGADRFSASSNSIQIVQSQAGAALTVDASKTQACLQSAANPVLATGIPTGIFQIPEIDQDIKNTARFDFTSTTPGDYTNNTFTINGTTFTFVANTPADSTQIDLSQATVGGQIDTVKLVSLIENAIQANITEPDRFVASGSSLEIMPSSTGGDITVNMNNLGGVVGELRNNGGAWVEGANVAAAEYTISDSFITNDLDVEQGSMVAAREKGLVRSEGKDYIMQDGDIVLFRFNV